MEKNILPSGVLLVLSKDNLNLNYGKVKNIPIIISQGTIKKIYKEKHNISLQLLKKLDNEIRNSVMVIDSLTIPGSKVVVLEKLHNNCNPILVIIKQEKSGENLIVNEVKSVYDKREFQNFLNLSYKLNKKIYKNKKTKQWLLRNGFQLPTRFAKSLVSSNKLT